MWVVFVLILVVCTVLTWLAVAWLQNRGPKSQGWNGWE